VFLQRLDKLVHSLVNVFERGAILFGKSGISAVVFRLVPSPFQNARKLGRQRVVTLLRSRICKLRQRAIRPILESSTPAVCGNRFSWALDDEAAAAQESSMAIAAMKNGRALFTRKVIYRSLLGF
jgi:hypothetical protein